MCGRPSWSHIHFRFASVTKVTGGGSDNRLLRGTVVVSVVTVLELDEVSDD